MKTSTRLADVTKPPSQPVPALRYRVAGLSDAGRTRALNEDCFAIYPSVVSTTGHGEGELLAVVADGMGGHAAGEVASHLAVDTVFESWLESPLGGSAPPDAVAAKLRAALENANEVIYRTSHKRRGHQGMGTTCTTLLLRGTFAYSSHIGDSRLYLRRGQAMLQLTDDDSAVMDLVRRGLMTERQASLHPDRNVLIRAMGTHRLVELRSLEIPLPVQPGDVFLLCSDGLHDLLAPEEMGPIVTDSEPAQACAALINLANERGGFDNITAVIVRIDAVP